MPFGGLKTTDSRLQSYCKDSGSIKELNELVTGSDPETAEQKPDKEDKTTKTGEDQTNDLSTAEEDSVPFEHDLQHKNITM